MAKNDIRGVSSMLLVSMRWVMGWMCVNWCSIIQIVLFNQIYFNSQNQKQTTSMNYFDQLQNQQQQYQPPQQPQQQIDQFIHQQTTSYQQHTTTAQDAVYSHPVAQSTDQQFTDFQEDEVTKRIRAQQQRIRQMLKQKSEQEWNHKQTKRETGRRQLQEFINKKQEEKANRAASNVEKQKETRDDMAKLNVQANWRKVMSNVNMRIGERKGTKDINRMREAILHRREDEGK